MLAPDSVAVPVPALVSVPVLVLMDPWMAMLPAPSRVRLCVPYKAMPLVGARVSVPASLAMLVAPASATLVVSVLLPLILRTAPKPPKPVPFTLRTSAVVIPPCRPSVAPALTKVSPAPAPSAPL